MADYAIRKRGALTLPLTASTAHSALRDADPGIFYALEYLTFAVRNAIGARLTAEAAAIGLTIPDAVAHALPLDPKPVLMQEYGGFPMLAVYRVSATLNNRTLSRRHIATRIAVEYILPPLNGAQAERLCPLLTAAVEALDMWTDQGWDPSFAPTDGAAGDTPWDAAFAGVEKISLDTPQWGFLFGAGELPFYAVKIQGQLLEIDTEAAGAFVDFEGVDGSLDVTDPVDGTVVADVAQIATHGPPTLASIAPATAAVAGGAALTLKGTLFRNPVEVFIGGRSCPDAVATSDTAITCAAPPGDDIDVGIPLDVDVVNADGQSAVLAAAFTYT